MPRALHAAKPAWHATVRPNCKPTCMRLSSGVTTTAQRPGAENSVNVPCRSLCAEQQMTAVVHAGAPHHAGRGKNGSCTHSCPPVMPRDSTAGSWYVSDLPPAGSGWTVCAYLGARPAGGLPQSNASLGTATAGLPSMLLPASQAWPCYTPSGSPPVGISTKQFRPLSAASTMSRCRLRKEALPNTCERGGDSGGTLTGWTLTGLVSGACTWPCLPGAQHSATRAWVGPLATRSRWSSKKIRCVLHNAPIKPSLNKNSTHHAVGIV